MINPRVSIRVRISPIELIKTYQLELKQHGCECHWHYREKHDLPSKEQAVEFSLAEAGLTEPVLKGAH
jgi:hypothetical protein